MEKPVPCKGAERVSEILGRDEEIFDDVLAQLRQHDTLQMRHDQIAIPRAHRFPVNRPLA